MKEEVKYMEVMKKKMLNISKQ